jgi:hypothetical protein
MSTNTTPSLPATGASPPLIKHEAPSVVETEGAGTLEVVDELTITHTAEPGQASTAQDEKTTADLLKAHAENDQYEELKKIAYKAVTGEPWHEGVKHLPKYEQDGILYFYKIKQYLAKHKHQFLKDETGSLFLLVDGVRVPLAHDKASVEQSRFMRRCCGISNLCFEAQNALRMLEEHAHDTDGSLKARRFAAFSADRKLVYVPIRVGDHKGFKVLRITADGFKVEENGKNEDKFWLDFPPLGKEAAGPFRWEECDPVEGLKQLERLCVNSQSTGRVQRWLTTMHEGVFPFVADAVRTRALMFHRGGTQQGKTTAAQRFTQLLGRGVVKGRFTQAALTIEGDSGLTVLDNREEGNFQDWLVDLLLYWSTGAESGAAMDGGKSLRLRSSSGRPVGVITSIEGPPNRPELLSRSLETWFKIEIDDDGTGTDHSSGTRRAVSEESYQADDQESEDRGDRDACEDEIIRRRDQICCAIMHVLKTYLALPGLGYDKKLWPAPSARRNLDGYFEVQARLLTAFEIVAEKPKGWAREIYLGWPATYLSNDETTEAEDPLDFPIYDLILRDQEGTFKEVTFTDDDDGTLKVMKVTEPAKLRNQLAKDYGMNYKIPASASSLSSRLKDGKFGRFRFFPTDHPGHKFLKRVSNKRIGNKKPIGFVLFDDLDDAEGT